MAVAGLTRKQSGRISNAVNSISSSHAHVQVRLLRVPHPGKRPQLAHGIREARGSILVLADDDVFWPPRLLPLVFAAFEDAEIGGVGTTRMAWNFPHSSIPDGIEKHDNNPGISRLVEWCFTVRGLFDRRHNYHYKEITR